MERVPIEKVIAELRIVFGINKEGSLSKENNGCFLIDKREYERDVVISALRGYFADKVILNGQCRIEPITLLYTMFHIEELPKEE